MRTLLITLMVLGTMSLHAQTNRTKKGKPDLAIDARHIVNFSPVGFVVAYGQPNPAISFDYEYVFNQEAGIGVRLPFALGYEGPDQSFNSGSHKHTTVYAAPGIRFHAPIGRSRRAEFATGPSIILGNVHFRPYDNYSGSIYTPPFNYGLTGFAADNSLNIYNRHFCFGFDLRIGSMVEVHEGTRFFIHAGMHFGGKF
jgi:hypothetical protein